MRMLKVAMCSLFIGMMCSSAMAQDGPPRGAGGGRGGPQQRQMLPPEQAKLAWETQATGVAKSLKLNEDQTKAAVKAYHEVRETQATSMRELMEKFAQPTRGEDGQIDAEAQRARATEMRKAFDDLNASQREKLKTELAKSLNAEQTDKAMAPLGSFNSNWDVMTLTVIDFKLPAEKQEEAVGAMQKYITTMASAMGGTDREAMRTANQEARRDLTETMRAMLTEEQFGQFQRAMSGGRGPAPAGGQRGARGGQGGGAQGGGGGQGGAGGGAGGDPE